MTILNINSNLIQLTKKINQKTFTLFHSSFLLEKKDIKVTLFGKKIIMVHNEYYFFVKYNLEQK